jgi:O-antigen/teichoic acid export membrane protein
MTIQANANFRSEGTSIARYRRIAEAVVTAVLVKGSILLVSLFSIPITVRYPCAERYGLWTTITTTITLFVVLDVGIANTLTNLISEVNAKGNKELAGHYAATAFWMMVIIGFLLGIVDWSGRSYLGKRFCRT